MLHVGPLTVRLSKDVSSFLIQTSLFTLTGFAKKRHNKRWCMRQHYPASCKVSYLCACCLHNTGPHTVNQNVSEMFRATGTRLWTSFTDVWHQQRLYNTWSRVRLVMKGKFYNLSYFVCLVFYFIFCLYWIIPEKCWIMKYEPIYS